MNTRVYREQSLLQARLKNSEAPYILPHDKVRLDKVLPQESL